MYRSRHFLPAVVAALAARPSVLAAETLDVGDGKPFARIEEAAKAARPGDVVRIHPLPGGSPHKQPVLLYLGGTSVILIHDSANREFDLVATKGEDPPFVDAAEGDYRLRPGAASRLLNAGLPPERIRLPSGPGESEPPSLRKMCQYKAPLRTELRADAARPAVGACGILSK